MLNLKFALKLVVTILIAGQTFGQNESQIVDNQEFNIAYISSEIRTLESSIKEGDRTVITALRLAKLYKVSDQKEKAMAVYADLINRESVDPETYFEYGECLRSLGAYTDALIQFKKYAEYYPDQAKYFVQLCELSIENEKIADVSTNSGTTNAAEPQNLTSLELKPAEVNIIQAPLINESATKSAEIELPALTALESQEIKDSKEKLPPKTKVYFVQVTALTKFNPQSVNRFKSFSKYGDVYRLEVGEISKIRVGYFTNMNEALNQLNLMKKAGIKDAFLVEDLWDEKKFELLISANGQMSNIPENNETESSKYKIRVAEFKAPDWFDSSKISDLGSIEHWSKNGWTIIILSGFNSLDEVNHTISTLKSRGFKESYPVVEREGKLYRLQ